MIIVPKQDGIVHLRDLPKDEICIKLPDAIQKRMVFDALKIVTGRYNLARVLKVEPVNIYDFENCRFSSITLKFVHNISQFLVTNGLNEYSVENLENKIELIKSKFVGNPIYNPKFPINFNNEDGAQVISCILYDGGISSRLYPFYTNKEEILVDRFIASACSVIGQVTCRKYLANDGTFEAWLPRIIGFMLVNCLGIKSGKKTIENPYIPKFILKNKDCYLPFIQQAFDAEGSVNQRKSGRSIQLNQYSSDNNTPPIRLVQLKNMLEVLDIRVNGPFGPTRECIAKNGTKTYGWMIQISNQANIRNFSERINFILERKQRKLHELLDSYQLPPRFKNGTRYNVVLNTCDELKQQGTTVTIKSIAGKLNRKPRYVEELIRDMVDQKTITSKPLGEKWANREFEVIK